MADQSIYQTILDTMAGQVTALALLFNGKVVPVVVRKLPKKEGKPLDTVPLIVIAPSERPEDIKPFTTEDEVLVKYTVEVVFIAGGNRDFSSVNMDTEFRFREQIRRLFQFGIANISLPKQADLFFSEILPEAPLDRQQLNNMYEYSGIAYRFWVVESRTDNPA